MAPEVSRRRATLANLLGTGANTLVLIVQALCLMPLYLHALGPRLYGAWLGSGEILIWLQILDLGLPNLLIQRIGAAHTQGDSRAVGAYFGTGVVTLGLIALAVCCAGMAA